MGFVYSKSVTPSIWGFKFGNDYRTIDIQRDDFLGLFEKNIMSFREYAHIDNEVLRRLSFWEKFLGQKDAVWEHKSIPYSLHGNNKKTKFYLFDEDVFSSSIHLFYKNYREFYKTVNKEEFLRIFRSISSLIFSDSFEDLNLRSINHYRITPTGTVIVSLDVDNVYYTKFHLAFRCADLNIDDIDFVATDNNTLEFRVNANSNIDIKPLECFAEDFVHHNHSYDDKKFMRFFPPDGNFTGDEKYVKKSLIKPVIHNGEIYFYEAFVTFVRKLGKKNYSTNMLQNFEILNTIAKYNDEPYRTIGYEDNYNKNNIWLIQFDVDYSLMPFDKEEIQNVIRETWAEMNQGFRNNVFFKDFVVTLALSL